MRAVSKQANARKPKPLKVMNEFHFCWSTVDDESSLLLVDILKPNNYSTVDLELLQGLWIKKKNKNIFIHFILRDMSLKRKAMKNMNEN